MLDTVLMIICEVVKNVFGFISMTLLLIISLPFIVRGLRFAVRYPLFVVKGLIGAVLFFGWYVMIVAVFG